MATLVPKPVADAADQGELNDGSAGGGRAAAALGPPGPGGDAAARQRRVRTIRNRQAAYRRALAFADAISIGVVLWVGTIVLGEDKLTLATLAAALLLILLMKTVGLYDRDEHLLHKTTLDEIPRLFQVATLSALLLWLAGDWIVDGEFGRRQAIGMWILLTALLVVGRALARNLVGRFVAPERCLLLGDAAAADFFRRKLALTGSVRAELVGWLPIEHAPSANGAPPLPDVPAAMATTLDEQQVDRVVLAPDRVDGDALLHTVRQLRALEVGVSVLPASLPGGASFENDHIHGFTLLGARGGISRSSRFLKRSFDLAGSALLLVLLTPLLAAIAIAIKLGSPGRVLFRQRRIGRHGEPFEMLKFRSMHDDAEARREELMELNEVEGGLFKIDEDPRVTRVGRVIRRWSLDELAQLVNVLRGEMSLVGPRPLIPEEDARVEGHYRTRLDLAPGITGYWQALGASRIPLDEMVRLDYLYVAQWSLWNDVLILIRTIPYVFGGQGR